MLYRYLCFSVLLLCMYYRSRHGPDRQGQESQCQGSCGSQVWQAGQCSLSVCLPACLSLCLSVSLSLCLSLSLSVSLCLPVCLFVSLSLCPPAPLCLYFSIYLSLCLSVSICTSVSLSQVQTDKAQTDRANQVKRGNRKGIYQNLGKR